MYNCDVILCILTPLFFQSDLCCHNSHLMSLQLKLFCLDHRDLCSSSFDHCWIQPILHSKRCLLAVKAFLLAFYRIHHMFFTNPESTTFSWNMSRSFLQRQKVITSKSSSKNLSKCKQTWHFYTLFVSKTTKTEILWRIFWRYICRSIIGAVENFCYKGGVC